MNEPTHVDLFSGIGGFALAAQWAGFRTVAFCEIDKYCQKILAKNFMADTECIGRWSEAETRLGVAGNSLENGTGQESPNRLVQECRIHGNIFDFDGSRYRGCDLLTGGFPCQPFSVAGKRRGAADDRAIWPQMFRVIGEARPAWVLGENVPGIIPMELDNVLSDLEGIGYACRSFVIPACAVDARHRRDRLWIIANLVARRSIGQVRTVGNFPDANKGGLRRAGTQGNDGYSTQQSETVSHATGARLQGQQRAEHKGTGNGLADICECVSDANESGLERQRTIASGTGAQLNDAGDHCRWQPEPDVGRVAHGIPHRVDRLKGLGNAIVPQVAFEILREIRQLI